MPLSLMQKVLGTDWQMLSPVLQKHYQVADNRQSCLEGSMTIQYSGYMFPMIWLIHLFGGLVLWRGNEVHVQVQKNAERNNDILHWRRTMTYADGKSDYFVSQMHYSADRELIESIGFGFGLRLVVEVVGGDLYYRSNGYFWRFGKFELQIPDWMLLGTATISEHVLSDNEFYLDFTLKHPLWGVTYCYRGNFRYRQL